MHQPNVWKYCLDPSVRTIASTPGTAARVPRSQVLDRRRAGQAGPAGPEPAWLAVSGLSGRMMKSSRSRSFRSLVPLSRTQMTSRCRAVSTIRPRIMHPVGPSASTSSPGSKAEASTSRWNRESVVLQSMRFPIKIGPDRDYRVNLALPSQSQPNIDCFSQCSCDSPAPPT